MSELSMPQQQPRRHEPGEGYDGPAHLDGVPVEVRLRGHFEPIDGRFHWLGRVSGLDDAPTGRTRILRTPYGEASGQLTDVDPWGRIRITGTGRPPF